MTSLSVHVDISHHIDLTFIREHTQCSRCIILLTDNVFTCLYHMKLNGTGYTQTYIFFVFIRKHELNMESVSLNIKEIRFLVLNCPFLNSDCVFIWVCHSSSTTDNQVIFGCDAFVPLLTFTLLAH
jgi:hypothetical protein